LHKMGKFKLMIMLETSLSNFLLLLNVWNTFSLSISSKLQILSAKSSYSSLIKSMIACLMYLGRDVQRLMNRRKSRWIVVAFMLKFAVK